MRTCHACTKFADSLKATTWTGFSAPIFLNERSKYIHLHVFQLTISVSTLVMKKLINLFKPTLWKTILLNMVIVPVQF